jgi:glycosyltransferase involved in cell wall biosynthesis
MTQPVIALLGRKDEPTDAVEEYCSYLGEALQPMGFELKISRVPWEKQGWPASLEALRSQAADWRGKWILVQYTALAWSERGFSWRVLRVLRILRNSGVRVGVIFHDIEPFAGKRWVDRLRRAVQFHVMRRLRSAAELAIFTVSIKKVSWLSRAEKNSHFIPVGPNLPLAASLSLERETTQDLSDTPNNIPGIAVFSITGGYAGARETEIIINAARHAAVAVGKVRLVVFGRYAELRESALRHGLRDSAVELSVEGVIDPAQIIARFNACDVLLFIRGPISSRRGSAIAGIACGLPLVGYAGSETAPPITEAGVVFVPQGQPDALHAALIHILQDPVYRATLAQRSQVTYQAHFSWTAIAAQFAALLRNQNP